MENSTNLETVASDEMAIEESRRRVTTAVAMNSDGERNFVSARERRTLENFSDENNSFRAKYSVLVAPSLPRIFEALLRLGPEIMTRVPCFLLLVFLLRSQVPSIPFSNFCDSLIYPHL
jgi:hypothetical protein